MRKTRKIIICTNENWDISFINRTNKLNAEILFVKKNGKDLIKLITSTSPYLVCTDFFLPNIDAFNIISELSSKNTKLPAFIISSSYYNEQLAIKLNEFPIKFMLTDKTDERDLCEIILKILKISTSTLINFDIDKNLVIKVSEELHYLGVPAHLSGYKYLRFSIIFSCLNNDLRFGVTKKLYEIVAELFDTKQNKVERCIRHALETAWDRHDENAYKEYFKKQIYKKPTNSEFISVVTSKTLMN